MYKLIILSTLLVLIAGAPNEINHHLNDVAVAPIPLLNTAVIAGPTHIEVHEPTLAKIGDIVENVPTAVSHQSSTIVHSREQRIRPIVAPAVRSYSAPALSTYTAPFMEHNLPLLRALNPESTLAAYVPSYTSSLQWHHYHPLAYSSYGAPLVYATPVFKQ